MANRSKAKSSARTRVAGKNKMAPATKRSAAPASRRTAAAPKLDDVSDAPESGEPREQGRSRGRVIDTSQTVRSRSDRTGSASEESPARKRVSARQGADPRAAAERDESGNTRNEAWESGRQKAMEDEPQ